MWHKIKHIKAETKINIFLIIFFTVGLIGLYLPVSQSFFISLMPFSLILAMGLMFWMHHSWKRRHVLIFIAIALIGYFVEVAGVLTGVIFGSYGYGRALGFKIFETPPMIGLNWLMLIYAVYAMLRKIPVLGIVKILLGAGLMLAYDVVMEPVAMQLDMWDWQDGVIPVQNYIAWFAISVVLLSILHFFNVRFRNGVATTMFFIQFAFFGILNLLLT